MTDDVFAPTGDEVKPSPLVELVGEDKKFKTVEDLAKGKLEADSFIEQLKEEVRVAREELGKLGEKGNKEDQIAELLKAVRENQKQVPEDDNQVSDEDLSKRIKTIMQGETEAATAAKNRSIGNQAVLDKVAGDVEAAKTYIAERAKQLGMTPEGLAELSEKSPDAFAKVIEVDPSTVSKGITPLPGTGPMGGEPGPVMEIDGHKTKAYYAKLKADMGPSKYWNNSKIQGQYVKDSMFLQERFNQ